MVHYSHLEQALTQANQALLTAQCSDTLCEDHKCA